MSAMDPRVKDLWIAELQSADVGEQGKHGLRREVGGVERRCCLGVLCDIAVREGVIPAPVVGYNTLGVAEYAYGYDRRRALPPTEVLEWAGFGGDTQNPVIDPARDIDAATANDEMGMSFHEISLLIKEHL